MLPLALGVGGAFVVLAVVATLLSTDEASLYGSVNLDGSSLPAYDSATADGAVGMALPSIEGVDFDGNAVSITADGRPKVLLNLAHW